MLIDERRVLTCAHVAFPRWEQTGELWVALPKAMEFNRRRFRVAEVIAPEPQVLGMQQDVAVLVLEDLVPHELAARLRQPAPTDLVDTEWWSFGYPERDMLGDASAGRVGESLSYGWVRLDTDSKSPVKPGYSGAGLWSPAYQAVVGLVGQARASGDARALTMLAVSQALPDQKLHLLTDWSVEAAGEGALAAWGWSLEIDPEAGRHWKPRGRGVGTDAERGFRFRGRSEALTDIVAWISSAANPRRALAVTGSPGVGKSAVLGRIVTSADRDIAATLPTDDAVRAPVGSVACAVHAKSKTALEVAQEIARAASAQLPADLRDFAPKLRSVLEQRPSGNLFAVVIDALDEATTPGQARAIVSHIVRPLVEHCGDIGLRLVVGSRRQDDAGDLLGTLEPGVHTIDLDASAYFQESDLAAYAMATLQLVGDERLDNPYADDEIARPVAERIASLATGNFLIAGLVARSHGMHDHSAQHPRNIAFVPSVGSALHDYVAMLPPVGTVPAAHALAALAYAEAPGFSLALWCAAIGAMFDNAPSEAKLWAFAKSSAANFLVETTGGDEPHAVFRLFHQALNDALAKERCDRATSDENAVAKAFLNLGQHLGWANAPTYLLRSLPRHADRGQLIDLLLQDDDFLLHADLARLIPVASTATTSLGRSRARLLRKTTRAIGAGPADRIAFFSVTETLEGMEGIYRQRSAQAPFRGEWAVVRPHAEAEEAILEGHTGTVTAICTVDSGGRSLLASGGSDKTVRLWDPATGQQMKAFEGHWNEIEAICPITLDGQVYVASAAKDHTVQLWDLFSHNASARVSNYEPVQGMCAIGANDQQQLLAVAKYKSIDLWHLGIGEVMKTLDLGADITAVAPIAKGGITLLAVATADSEVSFWTSNGQEEMPRLNVPAIRIKSIHEFKIGEESHLAICADSTLRIYNDREVICSFENLMGMRRSRFLPGPDGEHLIATVGDDLSIQVWNLRTGVHMHALEGHTGTVQALSSVQLGDRHLLATGGEDRTVRLWDPALGDSSQRTENHSQPVRSICVVQSSAGRYLATSSNDPLIRVWDPHSGSLLGTHQEHQGWVYELASVTLPDRPFPLLASASNDGTVCLWDTESWQLHQRLRGHRAPANALCELHGAGLEGFLASADESGYIAIWDARTGERTQELSGGPDAIRSICSISNNPLAQLASADANGEIRLWDLHTGEAKELASVTRLAATSPRLVLAFEIGSKSLLAISAEHTVELRDLATGRYEETLFGHTGRIISLCTFKNEGLTLLATASTDCTVRIWETSSWRNIAQVPVRYPAWALADVQGILAIGLKDGLLAIKMQSQPPLPQRAPIQQTQRATSRRFPWIPPSR
ncbi:AAA family ATPase [Streptacidiphilus sp. P02-A3a]|uniref:AAA family ATPase n=1 Tax=Streptacidiphilus sp. P02-A3a TaxID=2704468 RepID=UPI0015FA5C00|nr:AAA family ATPase [Streptacidiphilus sp. P02-A3a]QMU68347.1 hypothetical protein GXP74_09010 [Streptacidiphilus sp. P02-A3a]